MKLTSFPPLVRASGLGRVHKGARMLGESRYRSPSSEKKISMVRLSLAYQITRGVL